MTLKIAISGASGLIGSAVASKLEQVAEIVRVGRRPIDAVHADFSEPGSLATMDLRGCHALVHCAGVIDEDFASDPGAAIRKAFSGASALVSAAARSGVGRICYISSAHIYGPLTGNISEHTTPNPVSDYAIAHFATEQIFRRSAANFDSIAVFRPCAVFGFPTSLDRFVRWSLIPFGFPRDSIARRKIVLKSSGLQRRNFISSDDIGGVVAAWLNSPSASSWTATNVVGPATLSVWEFARLCSLVAKEHHNIDVEVVRPAPEPDSAGRFDFEYDSIHRENYGTIQPADFVAKLMDRLISDAV